MSTFSLLIYRGNKILHSESFNRNRPEFSGGDKLTVGMLSAITSVISILSEADAGNRFESLSTPEFRLDMYQTLTGYTFVLLSGPQSESKIELLERIYSTLFVPLVVRNPLFDGNSIQECLTFRLEIQKILK